MKTCISKDDRPLTLYLPFFHANNKSLINEKINHEQTLGINITEMSNNIE